VESLAWHVTELLSDPAAAAEMSARAYVKVLSKYDPAAIAEQVQAHYDRLTGRMRRLVPEPIMVPQK
jgi:hypothetical protein